MKSGPTATCASRSKRGPLVAAVGLAALVGACGGGGAGGGGPLPPAPVDTSQRVAAATATAESGNNPCAPIQPFYWEVGDQNGRLASGSVPSNNGSPLYTGVSLMSIASASKWLYGAYVVQARQGQLTDDDIKYLTFRSGYTSFSRCLPSQTVLGCVNYQRNGAYDPATDGLFSYGGGHMEKHASLIGLGAMNNAALADEMRDKLGSDIALAYSQPQLAGGVVTSADAYAVFLRKVLAGGLSMKAALGTHAVCTNPATCAQARNTPVPSSESYHYSIGHWVEDDPLNGDGAFSSAGAFGFYPWIDASKTWYGIVAREDKGGINDPDNPDSAGHGFDSARCGQLIRAAWIDGVAR
ncbi:MAG: hypothetical protein LKCHEGNO_02218 [Burkholderiaceae bacterium]|nr:hypothetical protein [Burkholderiaceae bacterium]